MAWLSGLKPVKTVLQFESAECAAASLAMILNYHGFDVLLSDLRQKMGVSRDGASARIIVETAKNYGLQCSAYRVKSIKDVQAPAILFWQGGHFLVYEGCKGDDVFLNDPAFGKRIVTQQAFYEGFSQVVLEFNIKSDSQIKRFTRPDVFLSLLFTYKWHASFLALVQILKVLAMALFIFLTGAFLDSLVYHHHELSLLNTGVVLLLALSFYQIWIVLLKNKFLVHFIDTLHHDLLSLYLHYFLYQPYLFVQHRSLDVYLEKFILIRQFSSVVFLSVMQSCLQTIPSLCFFFILFFSFPVLTLVLSCVLATIFLFYQIYKQRLLLPQLRSFIAFREFDISFQRMQGVLSQIQQLSLLNACYQLWMKAFDKSLRSRLLWHQTLLFNQKDFLLCILVILVFLFYLHALIDDNYIGEMLVFIFSFIYFQFTLSHVFRLPLSLNELALYWSKITELVQPIVKSETDFLMSASTSTFKGINFQGLSFSYTHQQPLFSDVNLNLKAGQCQGVLSLPGQGLSTLAKVMMDVLPSSTGHCISDPAALNFSMSYCHHDMAFFEGSLLDHLRLWQSDITVDDIQDLADELALFSFLSDFDLSAAVPQYFYADIEAKMKLQLLMMAIKKPDVLFMDGVFDYLPQDLVTRFKSLYLTQSKSRILLLSSRRRRVLSICDTYAVLDSGCLLSDLNWQTVQSSYAVIIDRCLA
eukprot:COSAG01_NODE_412_length_17370_cov_26.910196_3_plen_698_part_00